MTLQVNDIIDFVETWRMNNGFSDNEKLSDKQIEKFVFDLQEKVAAMDYSVPDRVTIIAYSGESNGDAVWKIVDNVVKQEEKNAFYISKLSAGSLIGEHRDDLEKALNAVVGEDNIGKIMSGYDADGNRLERGSCGFGKNLLSLDDFVSAQLMGETIGASENVIAFIPENLDSTKVFASTELEQIFKNDTFQFINGIPKGELESIYRSGEAGKQAVYDIIKKTAKEAVGDTKGIEPQAQKLKSSFEENGILNSRSSVFSIFTCFDANGRQIGVELDSSKAETSKQRHSLNLTERSNCPEESNCGTADYKIKCSEQKQITGEGNIMEKKFRILE